jgi:hypothetical protein
MWVWLSFDLVGVGVVLRRVCNLWHCRGIGYLWNWRRLRMVGGGIVVGLVIGRSLGVVVLVCMWWK